MKVVTISDTHEEHRKLTDLPPGDMIIHCGDSTNRGWHKDIQDFCNWFGALDYKYKIIIPGNHDFLWEDITDELKKQLLQDDIILLIDEFIEIEGVKIYGTPWSPIFCNWAFMLNDMERNLKWQEIPENLDILITHAPPKYILDLCNEHAGCEFLMRRIKEVKPKYHVFGHIHEGFGTYETDDTTFINASISIRNNNFSSNKPITFEI